MLLSRSEVKKRYVTNIRKDESSAEPGKIEQISTGSKALDKLLMGGFAKGSNLLAIGALGKGKSTFARNFMVEGLKHAESCLLVAVDDSPASVRSSIEKIMSVKTKDLEDKDIFRIIDAYSWSLGENYAKEKHRIEGVLSLDQLSEVIGQAGAEIGQSIQKKAGGRRVIDSISSFFVNFELPAVQRFLASISKTALSFGGVTTIFIAEEGAENDHVMNNIKNLMDGVLEFKVEGGKYKVKASNMKWIKHIDDWIEL
jgi:circadian clock protein KaiC